MNFQLFVLKQVTEESEEVRTFKFTKKDGSVPVYKPGHFFLLRLPGEDGKPQQRSYSVASHPDEDALAFCIKLKGSFTHMLWKLKSGDTVEIDGPYGIFLLNPSDTERIFVGGGVGISALRSMIIQTVKYDNKRAWLFHSARQFDGLTYFPEMKKLAAENPHFKFNSCVTGEEKPAGWNGYCERISVPLLKQVLGTLSDKTFYLCGSKEMCGGLATALQASGVPKEHIKKDEWG
ncbi:MAG: FAD-dependent oxidoreductase [Candidatus Micrarchaeota archaeon]|nr:FAD-dependent oxidoreductase [Candidatus Micrarchaeota archaeon]